MVNIPEEDEETISHEDVRAFLGQLLEAGWYVRKVPTGEAILVDRYKVDFGHDARVFVDHRRSNDDHISTMYVSVVAAEDEEDGPVEYATDARHLVMLVSQIARRHGVDISRPPSAVRLAEKEPATNVARLVQLVGASTVHGVFDPYLDDRAVRVLLTMQSLGARFAANLRLLTGQAFGPRLHQAFVGDAFTELAATTGEIKRMGKQHRRFMLLDGDDALIIGNSLNQMAQNEAASRTSAPQDHKFFDTEWQSAGTP